MRYLFDVVFERWSAAAGVACHRQAPERSRSGVTFASGFGAIERHRAGLEIRPRPAFVVPADALATGGVATCAVASAYSRSETCRPARLEVVMDLDSAVANVLEIVVPVLALALLVTPVVISALKGW